MWEGIKLPLQIPFVSVYLPPHLFNLLIIPPLLQEYGSQPFSLWVTKVDDEISFQSLRARRCLKYYSIWWIRNPRIRQLLRYDPKIVLKMFEFLQDTLCAVEFFFFRIAFKWEFLYYTFIRWGNLYYCIMPPHSALVLGFQRTGRLLWKPLLLWRMCLFSRSPEYC